MEERTVSVVSIVRCEPVTIETAVREAVKLAEGFDSFDWKNSRVLIKPNSVNPSRSGSGMVTDARIVEAVAKLVLEKNPKNAIIGEGSSVGYDFPGREDSLQCMKIAGVTGVAERLGLEVIDLNQDEQIDVKPSEAYVMETFSIARTALESNIIISLPVLKTHVRTGITCGLKNMKGVLPSDEKKRTHQCGLDRGIVDLNRVVRPHFTVVDGIVGLQGTHQKETDRVPLGIVLAGNDVVAVDAVCAKVAHFDPKEIMHVQLAAEAGLGTADMARIEIRGEAIEAVSKPFLPYLKALKDLFGDATIIEKNTCTGCMGEMVSTFIYLKEAGFENKLADLLLIMGTPEEVGTSNRTPVIVGRCAKEFKDLGIYVPGCPPHGIKITDGACDALGIDKEHVHRAIDKLHDF